MTNEKTQTVGFDTKTATTEDEEAIFSVKYREAASRLFDAAADLAGRNTKTGRMLADAREHLSGQVGASSAFHFAWYNNKDKVQMNDPEATKGYNMARAIAHTLHVMEA